MARSPVVFFWIGWSFDANSAGHSIPINYLLRQDKFLAMHIPRGSLLLHDDLKPDCLAMLIPQATWSPSTTCSARTSCLAIHISQGGFLLHDDLKPDCLAMLIPQATRSPSTTCSAR